MKYFRKSFKLIIVGILGLAAVGLGIAKFANHPALADSTSNTASNPVSAVLQVETNQVHRGTWNMTVTGVSFSAGSSDPSKKWASVQLTFENAAGKDKTFLPDGYVTALVGTSGKTYDLSMKESLSQMYSGSQEALKQWDEDNGQTYYPGNFVFNDELIVDADEENFTKVIYQDGNGQKVEIPIQGITSEIVKSNPDAK